MVNTIMNTRAVLTATNSSFRKDTSDSAASERMEKRSIMALCSAARNTDGFCPTSMAWANSLRNSASRGDIALAATMRQASEMGML